MATREWAVRFEVSRRVKARTRVDANDAKDDLARRLERHIRKLRGFARIEVYAGPAEAL